jgi:hypothetical protein
MTVCSTARVFSSRTDTYEAVLQVFNVGKTMSKIVELPAAYVPPGDLWTWSPAFLAMLDESREDIAAGKCVEFSNADELLEELDSD